MSNTYEKIIAVSLYNRPDYTDRVIEGLKRCVGIQDYTVLFHCEPGNELVLAQAQSYPHKKEIHVNAYRLGCNQNIFGALNHGFRRSNFVIMVEDDCVPAPDFLQYMEWCRVQFEHDKSVFTAVGYRKGQPPVEQYHKVQRVQWFTPWGWATWADRFDEMRKNWGIGTYDSWDLVVGNMRGNRTQIEPMLARTQNIGAENGAHVPHPDWHRENQFNEFWAGQDGLVVPTDQPWAE